MGDLTAPFAWRNSCPEARPLLRALATSFSSACVLFEEEARRYADICGRQTPLPPFADATFASHVLFDAPFVLSQGPTAVESAALQAHLACVYVQIHVLTDACDQEDGGSGAFDGTGNWDDESDDDRYRLNTSFNGVSIRGDADDGDAAKHVLATLCEQLHDLGPSAQMLSSRLNVRFTPIGSADVDDILLSNIEVEHRGMCTMADIVDKSSSAIIPNDIQLPHELPSQDDFLKSIVDSYAQLYARLPNMKAESIRAEAMTASLSTHGDGMYVEMNDNTSIQCLTTELRTGADAALSDAAQAVAQCARKHLCDRIYVDTLVQSHFQVETKIHALEECVLNLVEQCLRILCVRT